MMRRPTSRRGEPGQTMVFVTFALVLAVLVLPPLLMFVFTANETAQIRERRMLNVYAADAGIEDGYLKVKGGKGLPSATPVVYDLPAINEYGVNVVIYKVGSGDVDIYRVVSTATSGNESATHRRSVIESYLSRWNYWELFDNAMTSYGDITMRPGTSVTGNVTLNGAWNCKGTFNGNLTHGVPGWPDADDLIREYWENEEYGVGVGNCTEFGSATIDVSETPTIKCLHRTGALTIKSTADGKTGTANGTIYVTDTAAKYDLQVIDVGKEWTLDLNGQTIFCEGGIEVGGSKMTVKGPGCIIGLKEVYFHPKISAEGGFIFIMSLGGGVQMQPNGSFTGGVAGNTSILEQPGSSLRWVPHPDLNFPNGTSLPDVITYTILE
jgi:hypothetical protein